MLHFAPRLALPFGFCALFAAGVWFGRAEPVQTAPKVVVHPVAGSVSYIEGDGGNIGVCAGADGVLVIDDQMKDVEEQVLTAIGGISKAPWRFVLNTHFHGDHTGNNLEFGKRAPIIAHKNVRMHLLDPKSQGGAAPAGALPILTYDDGVTLYLNGEEIKIVHFDGGHTDSDSIVLFSGSNVVHMGDLFFAGRFPFVDLSGGGSVQKLVVALDAIIPTLKSDVKIIPGHGPLATLDDLKSYRAMLVESIQLVGDAQRAGKTVDEMKAAHLLKKFEKLDWQFVNQDRFIETVARDLAGK